MSEPDFTRAITRIEVGHMSSTLRIGLKARSAHFPLKIFQMAGATRSFDPLSKPVRKKHTKKRSVCANTKRRSGA